MKANELMLGDWVKSLKEDHSGEYAQVIDIDHHDTVLLEYQCVNYYTDVEHIEPIPITPEILENNGFTHSFGDSDFYDYEEWEKKVDDKTIRVIKDCDGCFCRVDDDKLTHSMGIAPYVHIMQHIIRIGEIEKTIEL